MKIKASYDESRCLQTFYELVIRYDISVDRFFFPKKNIGKTSQRLQLDSLPDTLSESGLRMITATAKEIAEVEKEQSNEIDRVVGFYKLLTAHLFYSFNALIAFQFQTYPYST